jgi:transposase InsO family protein
VQEDVVVGLVHEIRQRHPRIGTRKLKIMLERDHGIKVGRDWLFDVLDRNGLLLRRRIRHRRTTFSGHGLRTYPDCVKELVVSRPDEVWVTDITYLFVEGRSFYVFLMTDLYSRCIIGWKVSDNMRTENALDVLCQAFNNRNPEYANLPVIHHSDRGSQYCSYRYVSLLHKHGSIISMTETGDPKDNPVAERINGIIKNEYLYPLQVTASGLKRRVYEAIRRYNCERPHLSLSGFTPEHVYRTSCPVNKLWKNYYPYYQNVDAFD